MRIERIWAMPNSQTFLIKPIKELIDRIYKIGNWVDPFCGSNPLATYKNDLNPGIANKLDCSCMDALEFLEAHNFHEYFDGCFFDPPYSFRQASECYKKYGREKLRANVTNMQYWATIKDKLAMALKPQAMAICCGWNSAGLGKSRGFEMIEVLLVPHGGSRNDTIVTVEKKK